jgi:hypothetical protein
MAKFSEDATVMAIAETVEKSTRKLQSLYLNKKWQMKLNEYRSVQIAFAHMKIGQRPIFINGTHVPYANRAKYLGMTLDAELRWKEHNKKKSR